MGATMGVGTRRPREILAIPGSIRRGSYNRQLLEAAVAIAPPHVAIRVYEGLGTLPLFDEDLERASDGGPDPVKHLRAAVAAADGLLIATPEYNWSIPGVLKNAVDWLSRQSPDDVLGGKAVAIIGASTGAWGTRQAQAVLRHTLAATESIVMPAPTLFVRDAARRFDAEGALVDSSTLDGLTAVVARFIDWIDAVAPASRAPRHPSGLPEVTT